MSTATNRTSCGKIAYVVIVIPIFWLLGQEIRFRDTPSQPVALQNVVAAPAVDPHFDVIEFSLPMLGEPAEVTCLVGSLGDAGDKYPVTIEMVASRKETSWVPNQPRVQQVALSLAKPAEPDWREHDAFVTTSTANRERVFFIQTGATPSLATSYKPITARLAAEAPRVLLWLDVDARCEIPSDDLSWVANCLEQEILPRLTAFFGPIDDLDSDGKLSICLTPRLAELPTSESPVEGMVQVNDFLTDLPRPFSNQADVLFLTTSLRPGIHLKTILAHEAAHLAVFSRRREIDPSCRALEDDWLNEGLAHFAEQVCGGDWSNLGHRFVAFAANPASSPLIVTDAGRQGLWRHPGARGAAWLFLAWLADEYGEQVVRDLAMHPGIGCEKLEQIVQQPFAELFRRWSVAVWTAAQDNSSEEIAAVSTIQPVSFERDASEKCRLKQGLQRAGQVAALDFDHTTERYEGVLRGTAFQACRWTASPGKPAQLRITAPKQCRLQVTLVEQTVSGPRVTTLR